MKIYWEEYLLSAFSSMVNRKDIREIGKILAIANEYYQKDWINENTKLKVDRVEEMDKGNDGSGYDLLSSTGVRIQSKFRSNQLHFENTRRSSKKNIGKAMKTGHVAYKIDEADIVLITRPNNDYINLKSASLIAIPMKELEDLNNVGFCRTRIPSEVVKKYEGKTIEVLEGYWN